MKNSLLAAATLCCTLMFTSLHGQVEESNLPKFNIPRDAMSDRGPDDYTRFAVHGVILPAYPILIIGSIRADYFFKPHNGKNMTSFFVSPGFTIMGSEIIDETYITWTALKAGMLVGKGSHHFEMQTGAVYISDSDYAGGEFMPSFTLGYRLQEITSNVVIRGGVGFPEFGYFSVGYNF